MSLQRQTPLRRKALHRAKPKRAACTVRGCKRRPFVAGELCLTHAKREADRLFSLHVRSRDGRCMAAESFGEIRCNGGLQTMHLVSRRYLSVRYDPDNARAGCAAHHTYLTMHPIEHDDWCEETLGTAAWRSLRSRARSLVRPDYAGIIALYREAA